MLTIIITIIKVIFLLGILVIIHEAAHMFAAKLCKVKVLEFSIGFGPQLWHKQGKETKYSVRAIPLGGYVNMLGMDDESTEQGSYRNASVLKRIFIASAGGIINILFGLVVFFFLVKARK